MHLWKKDNENSNINYYENAEDAIGQWIATVQAIGITLKRNKIKIYAPYGLSDILNKIIRPIKHKHNSKDLFVLHIEHFLSLFNLVLCLLQSFLLQSVAHKATEHFLQILTHELHNILSHDSQIVSDLFFEHISHL